jgi:crotonobetaine/carnitine-CoA ligase
VPRYVQTVTEFPRSATKREIERPKLKAMDNTTAWDRVAVMGRISAQAR